MTVIKMVRPPTEEERARDKEVISGLLYEYEELPEPKPDLVTWLNGACSALLFLRGVKQ